jgi:curli biogenesis system outer membrane secretion channel CsgG
MKKSIKILFIILFSSIFSGCVTTSSQTTNIKKTTIVKKSKPTLKRKVAIARFNNESKYGKSNLFGVDYNVGKQATDILSAKLAKSGKFILLERSDIDKINHELSTHNLKSLNIGADYLIVGSISEFGRKNIADTGVFSRDKIQIAYAKVNVRLIDVQTGQIIFAQEGTGEAKSEAGTAFGIGRHIGYDSTLNDKAISAAIANLVDGITQNLLNKPWKSYVLSINGNNVIIAGGKKQGLRIGDIFSIYIKGKTIKNPQTGIPIELPGKKIANIKVVSQFGSNYTDEGSICQIIKGNLKNVNIKELYVAK